MCLSHRGTQLRRGPPFPHPEPPPHRLGRSTSRCRTQKQLPSSSKTRRSTTRRRMPSWMRCAALAASVPELSSLHWVPGLPAATNRQAAEMQADHHAAAAMPFSCTDSFDPCPLICNRRRRSYRQPTCRACRRSATSPWLWGSRRCPRGGRAARRSTKCRRAMGGDGSWGGGGVRLGGFVCPGAGRARRTDALCNGVGHWMWPRPPLLRGLKHYVEGLIQSC